MEKQPGTGTLSKTLSVVLVLIILGALVVLIYAIAVPPAGDTFTEFYLLGQGGEAADYPSQLRVGEEARVLVGIGNQERSTVSYRVEIKVNGTVVGELGTLVLKHGEKSERMATFVINRPGERQRVEFLLYKEGQTGVYESLHLWVDVANED